MSRRCVRSASFLFPVSSVVLSVGGNLSLFALLLFAAELVDCGQVAGPPAPQRGDHLSLAGDAPSGWHFRSAGSRPSRPAGPSLATPAELPIKLPILALLDSTARSSSGHELEHINGSSLLLTAQDAVAHVNALQLVPGFQLELVVNDSKCDSGAGVDAFFHAIYTTKDSAIASPAANRRKANKRAGRPFIMLLGPHCSHVTESVAGVTSYWNIVQISHAATSAGLSDRQKYPFFFRTAAAESTHNAARLAFLRHFRWDSVSVLVQNEDDYSLVINDLSALLEDANTTVSNSLTFAPDELTDQFEILKERDARVIIGSFANAMAMPIFCEVHRRNLYGADHVWIWPGSLFGSERWIDVLLQQSEAANRTCGRLTRDELLAVIEGSFFLRPHHQSMLIDNGHFQSYQLPNLGGDDFHGEIYDAVWTMALALRELQLDYDRQGNSSSSPGGNRRPSLADFSYARKDVAEQLMAKIASLRFQGASGLVSFSGADRIGTTALFQIQGGVAKQIGLFHPDMGLELNGSLPVLWLSGQPPVATRIIKYRIDTVAPAAFYAMTLLAAFGIAFALICLSFNLAKRKLKYIKLSSPKLNNMAIVGSVLVYGAVILMGVDHATLVRDSGFAYVCMGRAYFLSAGFSLAFGAMFTKTFRVHRIFSMRNSLLKNRLLADTQLIGLILVLLLMDTIVIGLWIALDPLKRHLYNLPMVVSPEDRSVVYQPQVEICRSERSSMWLGILYVKKGLLLVGGVYMAWETRKVAIPALNDSPYIGMNVYNVVLTSMIVVFCDSLLSDRTTLNYLVVATLILTSATTALCLLFLPKFHAVWRQSRGGVPIDPICHGTGLKLEFNTRRMVVDDRKELLTRAEILNRVYLRDVAKLDAEIQRLERVLARDHNSSVSTLDDYSSAIQAEVTQLYAMLERDQDSTTPSVTANGAAATAGADRTSTWDFPRVFNKLVSRSCISLCESRSQANAVAASGASNYSQVCAASVGWGSASCIAHQNYQLKRRAGAHGGSPLDHRKVNQSSLVTLLNLAVDGHAGCDAIYQLVDQSLLLVDQENSEEADSPRQMRPLRVFQSRGSGLLEDRNAEACFREEFIVSFEW